MDMTEKGSTPEHQPSGARTVLIFSLGAFASLIVLLLAIGLLNGNTSIRAATERSDRVSTEQLFDSRLRNAEQDVVDYSRLRQTLLSDAESTKSEIDARTQESDELCQELVNQLSSLESATHFTAEESARVKKRNYYLKSAELSSTASDSEIIAAFVQKVISTNVGGDAAELRRNLDKIFSQSRASLDRQSYALREIPAVQAKLDRQLQQREELADSLRPLQQHVVDLVQQVADCDTKIGEARNRVSQVRTEIEAQLARQIQQQREREEAELAKSLLARAASTTASRPETQRYVPTSSSPATIGQTTTGSAEPASGDRYYDETYRPPVGDHAVRGYYRKDGTYVKPHRRTIPDNSFHNNWSSEGNVNPYNGKRGTRTQ